MKKNLLATALGLACLLGASAASAYTPQQIDQIVNTYASLHDGRAISDDELNYYLDRADSGVSMAQISNEMANDARTYRNNPWRPRQGYVATQIVCTSENNQYRECRVPFNGRARLTAQISRSACIEGQTWGQKPGAVWVNRGCRARFGIMAGGNAGMPMPGSTRMVVCQSNRGRLRTCDTGFRGRVQLVSRLNNSNACIEGRTWGQREGQVWVSGGCRAQFASIGRPGRRDDGYGRDGRRDGGWNDNMDRNYAVTCSSTNNAQVRCDWDERYGQPRLEQQTSQSACIEGRTWGYDRGDVWVTNGCRARFTSDTYRR
jgi:hypothetical protein